MDLKKNQQVELTIDDLGKDGEGIGHLDGYALFVKDALPGERILAQCMKLKKGYGFARLVKILSPSKDRVTPLCPVAGPCGGCTLQHLSYEAQLAYKEKKVYDCLTRIGGVDLSKVNCESILGNDETQWHYRNKAQFPIRAGRDGKPAVGFFAGRTHSVIPVTDCAIQDKAMKGILETLLQVMEQEGISPYDEDKHQGCLRHIFIRRAVATGEIMICLVINEPFGKFCDCFGTAFTKAFRQIPGVCSILCNVNREKTNVILGSHTKLLWGKEKITDTIGGIHFEISAQSFYQVNSTQTKLLYETALSFADLHGGETVWDMYCGIGTISLFLASAVGQTGRVLGVEIVPEAIANARSNAKLNGIQNVEFFHGAAEDVFDLDEVKEKVGEAGMKADLVVVDPPRKGCDEKLLETMLTMAPEKIVYISCDPATLARDVKRLAEGHDGVKYELKKVRACDMFPQGGHVETIVALHRTNS